jgi:DNA-directed RNA polymerase subunit RPC12/RpoP
MAVYRCPQCNHEFQSDVEGVVECPSCRAGVRIRHVPSDGTAWDRKQGGWIQAYFATIKKSLGKPFEFFEDAERGGGFGRPLAFAMVNAFIVAILVAAYQLGFQAFVLGANLAVNVKNALAPYMVLSAPLGAFFVVAGLVVVVPLMTVAGLLISSGLYHLCLMILGEARRPFIQTFRVACYSTGPQLFQILPVAGGMVAGIWQLILTIIGLKVVHRTTYGKTVLAVFLPMLICCGLLVLFLAAVAGTIVAAAISSAQAA